LVLCLSGTTFVGGGGAGAKARSVEDGSLVAAGDGGAAVVGGAHDADMGAGKAKPRAKPSGGAKGALPKLGAGALEPCTQVLDAVTNIATRDIAGAWVSVVALLTRDNSTRLSGPVCAGLLAAVCTLSQVLCPAKKRPKVVSQEDFNRRRGVSLLASVGIKLAWGRLSADSRGLSWEAMHQDPEVLRVLSDSEEKFGVDQWYVGFVQETMDACKPSVKEGDTPKPALLPAVSGGDIVACLYAAYLGITPGAMVGSSQAFFDAVALRHLDPAATWDWLGEGWAALSLKCLEKMAVGMDNIEARVLLRPVARVRVSKTKGVKGALGLSDGDFVTPKGRGKKGAGGKAEDKRLGSSLFGALDLQKAPKRLKLARQTSFVDSDQEDGGEGEGEDEGYGDASDAGSADEAFDW